MGVGFNRDKWEQLERHVRGLTKLYANVYVCTGPLYLPKRDLGDGKNYVRYNASYSRVREYAIVLRNVRCPPNLLNLVGLIEGHSQYMNSISLHLSMTHETSLCKALRHEGDIGSPGQIHRVCHIIRVKRELLEEEGLKL